MVAFELPSIHVLIDTLQETLKAQRTIIQSTGIRGIGAIWYEIKNI